MQTLLIVEDEKMIRQGIKAMVQRCGVQVENILECSNGTDALELLGQKHVDVMFTDIRMQKMDGIELVRRVNELEDKPFIVAISGYDDFNYAVEMLRNGVKEYLLKPVERKKIAEILGKLDEEIEHDNMERSRERELGFRQIRKLIDNNNLGDEERLLIISRYEAFFYPGEYRICIYSHEAVGEDYNGIVITDTAKGLALILEMDSMKAFLENEVVGKSVGVSRGHTGLAQVSEAFAEASAMRELSFILGKTCYYDEDIPENVNERLKEKARELSLPSERTKRVQVIGTEKTDEVISRWRMLFRALEHRHFEMNGFIDEIKDGLSQIAYVYMENMTDYDFSMIEKCQNPFNYDNLGDYQEIFMDWLLDLNKRLANRPDDANTRQKILKAQKYVKENYYNDLNMAVVSNYVSMNYSLFSYSFKQYTGKNFVNYLKEIRIAKAKELLSQTDLKVMEISQKVGYENDKHFMKTFKALCGVSPREYRKNMSS